MGTLRFWLGQAVVCGCISGMLLGAGIFWKNVMLITIALAGLQYQILWFELLSEASYSKLVKLHPTYRFHIVSMVKFFKAVGSILGLLSLGIFADQKMYLTVTIIIWTFTLIPIIPTAKNWIDIPGQIPSALLEKQKLPWKVITLGIFSSAAAVGMAVISQYLSPLTSVIAGGVLMFITILLLQAWIYTPLALIACYQIILTVVFVDFSGLYKYFYTEQPCVNLPQLSYSFMFATKIAGTLTTSLVAIAYPKICARNSSLFLLVGSIGIQILSNAIHVLIALRVAPTLDKVGYISSEVILSELAKSVGNISLKIILALHLQSGTEATHLALLSGTHNSAIVLSKMMGRTLGNMAVIHSCDYENLWWISLSGQVITPAIFALPSPLLLIM